MSVGVTVTFPKGVAGSDISKALVGAMMAQEYQIDVQLDHQEATLDDQFVITDTRENEAKLKAFLHVIALPAFESACIPTPDIKISPN